MTDYGNPPPGYVLDYDEDWTWYAGRAGCGGTFDTEPEARSDAWAHYKSKHNPPGVLVTGRDDLRQAAWFAEGRPDHAAGFTSIAAARTAAWAWYDGQVQS